MTCRTLCFALSRTPTDQVVADGKPAGTRLAYLFRLEISQDNEFASLLWNGRPLSI